MRDWKTRDWETRHRTAWLEKVGLENAVTNCKGWERRDWKTPDPNSQAENAGLNFVSKAIQF